ncbi:hypothetical protein PHMEG_00011848 [Phytophthora megakarya]|uniref:CCHC-type domain-containing protein n=1 Tax=Phytophthora megakarya TaxID=4795 RepID=A0A225WCD0_9STRA|nr:hypothetical protein PHMEG_00011848 [Phytophthora megakarya]
MLSQSSLELPELVNRWLYQQNLRSDTSIHISQNIPQTLQKTIEHAQRFEDARVNEDIKPSKSRQNQNQQNQKGPGQSSTAISDSSSNSAKPTTSRQGKSAPGSSTTKTSNFVPTCHACGVVDHIAPACPDRQQGNGGKQKARYLGGLAPYRD